MSINHRRISVSIAAGLLLEAINKVSPLLILHHAQKTLGLADFGLAQYQLAMAESVQPFITYGFTNFALAEPGVKAENPSEMRGLFSNIFVLKLLNIFLVCLFIFFSTNGSSGTSVEKYPLSIMAIVFVASLSESMWYSITRHKLAHISLYGGILRLASLGMILAFIDSAADSRLFVVLCLLPNVLLSVYTGLYAYKDLKWGPIDFSLVSKIALKATPFALIILLTTVLDRVDIFLIEKWFGLETAGVYAGPAKVIQSLTLLAAGLAIPFYAEILKVGDPASLRKHISLSLWILSALTAPVIFGLPFIDGQVLRILFTDLPSSADHLMSLLAIGMIGTVLLSVFGLQILMTKSRPWPVVVGAFTGILIATSFVWLFRGAFGFHAAAYGIILGKLALGVVCIYYAYEFLPNPPFASLLKPMLAGGGMALLLSLIKADGLAANLVAGGACYLALLITLNLREVKTLLRHPKVAGLLRSFSRTNPDEN